MRQKLLSVEILSSILLVALSQNIGPLQASIDFRQSLKDHLSIVLGHPESTKDVETVMPNIVGQLVEDIDKGLKNQGMAELTSESKSMIAGQILALSQQDSRVRQIIRKGLQLPEKILI